jgi:hypothetical protein
LRTLVAATLTILMAGSALARPVAGISARQHDLRLIAHVVETRAWGLRAQPRWLRRFRRLAA